MVRGCVLPVLIGACAPVDLDRATLPYAITAARDAKRPMRRTRSRGVPTVLGIDHAGFIRLKNVGTEPTADEFLVFMKQAHAVFGTPADPADRIDK